MTGNLKALGLALVAALAMSAVAAPAAQASVNPTFTASEYPAELDATGSEAEKFTVFGTEVTCKHAKFDDTLTAASHELRVTPTYKECHAKMFDGVIPVTVTHNGCNYRFHHPTTEEGSPANTHWYTLTVDVVCPVGKQIEIHVYANVPDHFSGNSLCTLTVGSQAGLQGLTADVHTKPEPEKDDVTITGTVNNIKVQEHRNSAFCPGEGATPETSEGTYHLPLAGVTAQETNELGEFIDGDIG